MALPYRGDEDFGTRRGSYTPAEDVDPIKKVDTPKGKPGFTSFTPSGLGSRGGFMGRCRNVQEYLSRACCSCIRDIPTFVFAMIALLLIIAMAALIPIVVFLARSSLPLHEPSNSLSMRRYHGEFPKAELDASGFISAKTLLPVNVSFCAGYGFSCTLVPGTVIGTFQRCDGISDCPDGSDEERCRVCQTEFKCPKNGKGSGYYTCLRESQVCDGIRDCEDGSDEELHCSKECGDDEMSCMKNSSKICIPPEFICDGELMCPQEDDELRCDGKCHGGAIWCEGNKRCIPKRLRCDGIAHCPDGSDEKNCTCRECCGSNKALCSDSNSCIPRGNVCDGKIDCPDGADEEGCPGSCPLSRLDKSETVVCDNGQRLYKRFACSGLYPSCNKACDECYSQTAFTCANKKCVSKEKRCDGVDDCGDFSDEKGCDCDEMRKLGEVTECHSPTSESTLKCFFKQQRCDGVKDCPSGEDEADCDECINEAVYCPSEKTCITPQKRCDGVEDCSDGSDEKNCACKDCSFQPHSLYKCSAAARCFKYQEVCSPKSRCPNPSPLDKLFCANRARFSTRQ